MAVLLIGSTGNGKSTLGNFLVDPSEDKIFSRDHQHFKIAQTNRPETQNVSIGEIHSKKKKIKVIDTPGLNESDKHDLKHMIQIVEKLQSIDAMLGCIVVVKFNSKIDAQYKATLQYYRKLLPFLFERNVIIVMTDFQTDDRSVRMRQRQGIDVQQIKTNAIREVVESGSLQYEPLLFTIDCLPDDEEERKINLDVREAIICRLDSLKPFSSEALMVAKTAYLKSEDNKKIKGYEGEITGYNKRLQQANVRATEALEKIQQKEQEVTEIKKDFTVLQEHLREKDSAELTDIDNWSVSEEWKLLQWLSRDFERNSSCEIDSVDRWTNGHCEWKDYKQTQHRVSGTVEGKFMRGLYASVTLKASRRKKYETDITQLNLRIREVEKHMQSLNRHLDEIRDRYKEYTDDIKLLEQFIGEKRKVIQKLVSDYMSLDEAIERLRTLETK